MDADTALDVLRREAGLLMVSAGTGLRRSVPRYPDWTVADLVIHTGRIHRWVTGIIEQRATERMPYPDVDPDVSGLTDWFMAGAADLALTLQGVAVTTPVWTFTGDRTVGFWRRRMALETTIHRWDAQSAAGRPSAIPADVADAGVTEALHVYLAPRLAGTAVGGSGQHIALRATDTGRGWALTLHPDGIALGAATDDDRAHAQRPPDTTISATAEQLWLLLMGRCQLDEVHVDGDTASAHLCAKAVALVPDARR